jgi:tetratricopeptide (TPR) repeat protein
MIYWKKPKKIKKKYWRRRTKSPPTLHFQNIFCRVIIYLNILAIPETIMVDQIKERAAELVQQYSNETDNTFRRMVPIVLKKGLENINLEMFSEEIRTGILNAVAEELVKKGRTKEAITAYMKAKNQPKLIEIGDSYRNMNMFSHAIECYWIADAKDRLLQVGEVCLRDGQMTDAIKAFQLVEEKAKLLLVGDECLAREKFDSAIEVFKFLNNPNKLVAVGKACIKHDRLVLAAKAFELANATDELNLVGDIFLQKEQLNNCYEVYKLAGNEMMIQFLRDNFNMQ